VTAYVVGTSASGLVVGAVLGGLGRLVWSVVPAGIVIRLSVLAAASLAGVAAELGAFRLPSVARQVNDEWMYAYRGWVYGAGFGLQLGMGVITIVTSPAVYLVLWAELLSGTVASGAAIGLVFGMARGLVQLGSVSIDHPGTLIKLDALLQTTRNKSRAFAAVGQALIAATCIVGAVR
jgi:hypothetical protein